MDDDDGGEAVAKIRPWSVASWKGSWLKNRWSWTLWPGSVWPDSSFDFLDVTGWCKKGDEKDEGVVGWEEARDLSRDGIVRRVRGEGFQGNLREGSGYMQLGLGH